VFLFSISPEFLIQVTMTVLPVVATWVKLSNKIAILETKVGTLEDEIRKSSAQIVLFTKDLLDVNKEVNIIANKAIQEVQKITYHVEALQTNLQVMLKMYDTRIEKIESAVK
jgi:septal ring factor EnvC (AmiA/AmiB activator)